MPGRTSKPPSSGRPKRWAKPLGKDVAEGGAVDAVVIGSGAGGGPVALGLARAGYRVVVLEKGPRFDQRDFVYDEIRSCRRDLFVPSTRDEPHVRVGAGGRPQRTTDGWTANCVGGATVHFSGFTYRLHPEDLKLRTLLGEVKGSSVVDWPIGWAELEPYYQRIEYELGVSGVGNANPFEKRARPLPLPPLAENGLSKLIDAACKKLGYHSYPTARAILSRAWDGRAPCRRSFFCGNYGCETGAKSSVLAAILPKAVATGRCQVRPLSMVTQVLCGADGRASGVEYIDATGSKQRLRASVVVVACSAVESARLLLMSQSKAHPKGLGNQSDLVGRNLMFLGFGAGEAELDRDSAVIKAVDWSEPFVNRSVQDLYVIDRGKKTARKGGTLSFLLPHSNPIFTAEQLAVQRRGVPLWGPALKQALRGMLATRRLEFEVFSETLPVADSRVELDPRVKDRFGLPVARFTVQQHHVDREINSVLVDRGMAILRALSPKKSFDTRRGQQTYWLQAGTCRFGEKSDSSVLDRDCRVHSAPNVFVTDGSFMPTSGAVPNTLTIEANALRVADRIVALGKKHELFRKRAG